MISINDRIKQIYLDLFQDDPVYVTLGLSFLQDDLQRVKDKSSILCFNDATKCDICENEAYAHQNQCNEKQKQSSISKGVDIPKQLWQLNIEVITSICDVEYILACSSHIADEFRLLHFYRFIINVLKSIQSVARCQHIII
jgi:hypothetical protein